MAEHEYTSDIQAAVSAGAASAPAADRVTLFGAGTEAIPIAITSAGQTVTVLKEALALRDARANGPMRKTGVAVLSEEASFIKHIDRFKLSEAGGSVIFADTIGMRLTAVYDYHHDAAGKPQWCEHRAVYECPRSREWKMWAGQNEKPLTQDAFGALIEDNLRDLVAVAPGLDGPIDPDAAQPAAVLEMARNLEIHSVGTFQRTINPTTGEASLITKTEHASHSTRIPRAFVLGIPVFEGGPIVRVEARIRFSLVEGRPSFTFRLFEADRIQREAFNQVRERVRKATGLLMLAGAPEK